MEWTLTLSISPNLTIYLTMAVKLNANSVVILLTLHFIFSQEEYGGEEINDDDIDEEETDLIREPSSDSIFMVYWSQLSTLLSDCFICNLPVNIWKIGQQGVMIEAKLKCKKTKQRKRSYHGLIIITDDKKNGGGESNFISCHPLLWKYIWKDPGNDANCEYCFLWANIVL